MAALRRDSRVQPVGVHGLAAAGLAALGGWLHATGGYAVTPGNLLACPLHATTGLWCPFCGGLRCVAALSRGDLAGAASSNVVVLGLLPVAAVWWVLVVRAAWMGEPDGGPRLSNRGWLVLAVALVVFAVWRNMPALPFAAWLAP